MAVMKNTVNIMHRMLRLFIKRLVWRIQSWESSIRPHPKVFAYPDENRHIGSKSIP